MHILLSGRKKGVIPHAKKKKKKQLSSKKSEDKNTQVTDYGVWSLPEDVISNLTKKGS